MRIRPFPSLSSIGWPAWLGTLASFAVLCAIAAWWAMQLLSPRPPVAPASSAQDQQALPELKLASQLFGTPPGAQGPAAATSSNVSVIGIVAAGMRGSAILAIDGQPPRAFAVGERIGPIQSLFAVRADGVVIEENGRQILLPAPPRPTVSLLTDGPARAGGLDPGFASPADAGAARIARPLGAGMGAGPGAAPVPRAAAPGQGIVPVAPSVPIQAPAIVPIAPSATIPPPAIIPSATSPAADDASASPVPAAAASIPAPDGIAPVNRARRDRSD